MLEFPYFYYISPIFPQTTSSFQEIYLLIFNANASIEFLIEIRVIRHRFITRVIYTTFLTTCMNKHHITCNCIKGIKCSFSLSLLIFIYSFKLIDLLIRKYENFYQESNTQVTVNAD